MSLTKDEIVETFYTAGLATLGAVGVGYASRKLTRDGLGIPTTLMPIAKLAFSAAVSSLIVQYLQKKDYLPDNPFKKSTKST